MSYAHKLNKLLEGISDSGLSLDDKGSCQFYCKNGTKCIVELIPSGSRCLAYMPLMRLVDRMDVRNAVLEQTLKMNLRMLQTPGRSLALDERTEQVCLCSEIDLEDCTFDDFDQWLGDLIAASAGLKEELKQHLASRRSARSAQHTNTSSHRAKARVQANSAESIRRQTPTNTPQKPDHKTDSKEPALDPAMRADMLLLKV